jgi:hypothetical protein
VNSSTRDADERAAVVFKKYEHNGPESLSDDLGVLEVQAAEIATEEEGFFTELAEAVGLATDMEGWESRFWERNLLGRRLSEANAEHAKRLRRQYTDERASVVVAKYKKILSDELPDRPEALAQVWPRLQAVKEKYREEIADAIRHNRGVPSWQQTLWRLTVPKRVSNEVAQHALDLSKRIDSLETDARKMSQVMRPIHRRTRFNYTKTHTYETENLRRLPSIRFLGTSRGLDCFALPTKVWSDLGMSGARIIVDAPNAILFLPEVVDRPDIGLVTTGSLAGLHVRLGLAEAKNAVIIAGTSEIGTCIGKCVYIGTCRLFKLIGAGTGSICIEHLKPAQDESENHPVVDASNTILLCRKIEDVYDIRCSDVTWVERPGDPWPANPLTGTIYSEVACDKIDATQYTTAHARFMELMSKDAHLPITQILGRLYQQARNLGRESESSSRGIHR